MVHLIPRASVFAQARVKRENACLEERRRREGGEREERRSVRRNCIALQNGEALLFPRQPHLCSPFYSLHLIYAHTHISIYIYIHHEILINFRSTEESWKNKKMKKVKKKKILVSHSIVFIVEWMLKAKRRVKLQSKG